MDFIRKDNNRECFAIGQKGSLKWDGVRGSVDFFDEITKKWKNIYNGKNEMQISYVNQWKDIIFKIENDNKPFVDIYDAMAKYSALIPLLKQWYQRRVLRLSLISSGSIVLTSAKSSSDNASPSFSSLATFMPLATESTFPISGKESI